MIINTQSTITSSLAAAVKEAELANAYADFVKRLQGIALTEAKQNRRAVGGA